jgi:hypothetical protein
LNGCYSYQVINKNEGEEDEFDPDNRLEFVLKDNSVIEVKPGYVIKITEPTSLIFGEGIRRNLKTWKAEQYLGTLKTEEIDSLTIVQDYREIGIGDIKCWIDDTTAIYFKNQSYVRITPEEGIGYWCIGTITKESVENVFAGKINEEEIQELRIVKNNTPTVILYATSGLLGLVVVIAIVALISWGARGSPRGSIM